MKITITLYVTLFYTIICLSQPISTNTTTYSVPQLVNDVLLSNSSIPVCAGITSNITWSTGTNFGSSNGIGFFTNTNPSFPMTNGVILSTGAVNAAPGPNNTTQSNGTNTWTGDSQLLAYLYSVGVAVAGDTHHNATKLEFDFVPFINNINFDFVFTSEEYGTFQCAYSDAFAFFLSDVTTGSAPVNLALIPDTTPPITNPPTPSIPISVTTIRDDDYNSGCSDMNVQYFGAYTEPPTVAATASSINFNGRTVKMTAGSPVISGHTYHLKFVIADRNDNSFDSAVFIGNFNLGELLTGVDANQNIETDYTGQNAICDQSSITLNAGIGVISNATFIWKLNNVIIPNETSQSIIATQPGIYNVTVNQPGCVLTDDINIEFLPPMPISNPIDITNISNIFNLSTNIPIILNNLNPNDYELYFYTSLFDAQNNLNPILNLSNFIGINGQVIYVSILDLNSVNNCSELKSFILNPTPLTNETFENETLHYFPTPVKNILNISYSKKINEIEIINMLGQVILSKKINSTESQIDISSIAVGTYLMKMSIGDDKKIVKIIKE